MKFANTQFVQLVKNHPEWSSWTCFCETIKARGYKKSIIKSKFLELVEKEDYNGSSIEELLIYLTEL